MNNTSNKLIETNIDILEHLNNVSYSKVVIQIIKYLLFNRGQIPCPYETLNILINRHKSLQNSNKSKNIMVEKRFKHVLNTVQTLDKIFENLITEFRKEDNTINEVAIIFGSTIITPKEVFNIKWKTCESLDVKEVQRQDQIVLQILRDLMSAELQENTFKPLAVTNMFILLKKQNSDSIMNDLFLPKDNYIIPERPQRYNINLIHNSQCNSKIDYHPIKEKSEVTVSKNDNASLNLSDLSDIDELSPIKNIDNEYKMIRSVLAERLKNQPQLLWFQSKEFFKGFKSEMINGW